MLSHTGAALVSGTQGVTQGSGSIVLGQWKSSSRVLMLTFVLKGARLLALHVDKPAAASTIQLSGHWKQAT